MGERESRSKNGVQDCAMKADRVNFNVDCSVNWFDPIAASAQPMASGVLEVGLAHLARLDRVWL